MTNSTALVIRATGSQGREVCDQLLKRGFNVRGIVRDVNEDRAAALKGKGVVLVEGSLDDETLLDKALKGCEHLFLALMPRMDEMGSELRQAQSIIAAAKGAGVRQIVYTSNIGGLRSPDIDEDSMYFKAISAKQDVEKLVRSSGFETWTIFQPGGFMSNFFFPFGNIMFPGLASDGKVVTSMRADTVVPLIDPLDIGAFVADAFAKPKVYNGVVLELASEKMQFADIMKVLSKIGGRQVDMTYRSIEEGRELAKTNPVVAGQLMSQHLGDRVDMDKIRSFGVPLTTFEEYLKRESKLVDKTFRGPAEAGFTLESAMNKPS